MGKFIQQSGFLAQHASDADNRKGSNDSQKPYILQEGPRHFIDIDSYPQFATRSVSKNLGELIGLYDSATVFDIGIVPWAAVWTLDSLTARLQRGDWQSVWQSAADLGHYVGDAHQPLHATKYYGTSTYSERPGSGSAGIHSRYESTMIKAYQGELVIHPDSVHYITSPIDFMFDIVYQSNSYVDSIYDADVYARQVSGYSGSGSIPTTYTAALWEKTGGFTKIQFQRATQHYADLLYTAWVNAGSPDLTGIPIVSGPHSLPNGVWLDRNFPNPFNPSTTISFWLQNEARVTLAVYSLAGHRIAVLIDRTLPSGTYRSSFDASTHLLSSGLYLYRLDVDERGKRFAISNKMLYLK
jgi:hypothetical protein